MVTVAEQVAGEIQRSLDFYASTAADPHFSRVFLSGGTAKIPALFKTIETRVGVPVEIMNPFKAIEVDEDRKSTRLNSSHANISYAVFCLKKKKKNDVRTSVSSPDN